MGKELPNTVVTIEGVLLRCLMRPGARLKWYIEAVGEIGVSSVIRWQVARHFNPRRLIKLTAKSLRYPVFARPATTDQMVFHQIFIEHEYAPFDNLQPSLIVDCGAYVGYSAAYFLSRFPNAQLICIEPEPSNFSLLQLNLSRYSDRCILINGAIWPKQRRLRFQTRDPFEGIVGAACRGSIT